jgi:hypothetical protein
MGILALMLGCGVLVGTAALLWDWLGVGKVTTLHEYEIYLHFTQRSLAHVSRPWRQEDARFVHEIGGRHFLARLRQDRRRVRRLVLVDLRRQFQAVMAVATMLGALPSARRLNFGADVLLWTGRFHFAFVGLFLCSFPLMDRLPGSPASLLETLESAHRATRALMVALTDNDMADLESLILSE